MSIAVCLKVNDGVVLASDSASAIMLAPTAEQPARHVVNIYNNADKVFNLYKGLPIGVVTWGAGSIGNASIATLAKDLRRRLEGRDPDFEAWEIDTESYCLEDVTKRLCEFVVERYDATYGDSSEIPEEASIGFIVAGYSAGADSAEEYRVQVTRGEPREPELLRQPEEVGVTWGGDPAAISRIVFGVDISMPQVLRDHLGVPEEQIQPAMAAIKAALHAPLVQAAMPIQDAIDLAEFLVELTIRYSRFKPGPATVGGPIDVAAVTKHEHFKWIRRKYYYTRQLNPEEQSNG